MLQSKLFTKTQKEAPKDETSANAQLLIRAGFVEKLMAGVYSFLPLGLRVMKKIENIIREEINAVGGQEIFMPALQPKENWEKTGRWNTMDDLYKVKDSGGREFALGPTHEEVIVPLVQKYIHSYKDIPFYAYQIQNKFRMELRPKSGLLRGREFLMKDLYSFHLNEDDLNNYYEKVKKSYFNIFNKAGIGGKTHLTFATGGTFSKYSHEFQTLSEAGEDTIYICDKCKVAINKEIKHETPQCPQCGTDKFRTEKAIEVGNIFKIRDKFTKPFNLTVKDKVGKDKLITMGCYGIGLNRLMGTIVELHHDEKGIIWPIAVAPYQVHLLKIKNQKPASPAGGSKIKIDEEVDKIYKLLQDNGIEVLHDDREASAGEKFADADLIGIPYRVVVSEKSLKAGGVEVKKRNENKPTLFDIQKLVELIKSKK
ncbi:MAG: His/Gly/Thr/Pro-type tRNA ligase C-terminal domain-containing protein [Candidatus Moranbacteria bacterium]|nr:His/Gly/Thr/Pro-type tRNA ligase C-terminal domain-containing protein [Candidatus Moranbacteria bacterium]